MISQLPIQSLDRIWSFVTLNNSSHPNQRQTRLEVHVQGYNMLTTTKIIHIWGNLLLNARLSRLCMEMSIFWDMILCSCIYQTCITSQKTVFFIASVMSSSNLTKSYTITSSIQGILTKDTHQLCCRQQKLCVTAVCECWWTGQHLVSIVAHYGWDNLEIKSLWMRDFPHPSRPSWGLRGILHSGYHVSFRG